MHHAESLRGENHTKTLNNEGEFCVKFVPLIPLVKRSPFALSNQANGVEKVLQEINHQVDLVLKAMFLAGKIDQLFLTKFCNDVWNTTNKTARSTMIEKTNKLLGKSNFYYQISNVYVTDNVKSKWDQCLIYAVDACNEI